jgi:hypothetical protein
MVMGSDGARKKNDCAGEDQQKVLNWTGLKRAYAVRL